MRKYEIEYVGRDEHWTWQLSLDGKPFATSTIPRFHKADARSDLHSLVIGLHSSPVLTLPKESELVEGYHFRVYTTADPGIGQWGFFDNDQETAISTEAKPVAYCKLDIENLKADEQPLIEAIGRASF